MTASSGSEKNAEVENLRQELDTATQTIQKLRNQLAEARRQLKDIAENEERIRVLSEQLQQRTTDVQHERALARSLQERLTSIWLPDIDGLNIAVDSRVSEQVGADFYELIELGDGLVCFVVADVAGAGLQAALIMAMAKLAFRDAALHYTGPVEILDHVNSQLVNVTLERHYLTAFLGLLDMNSMRLRYVNASHCCPVLIRNEVPMEGLDSQGLFVGMFDEPHYEEETIHVERGDRLLLFTNGLLKAFGTGSCPDRTQLESVLQSFGHVSAHELIERILARAGETYEDDITIMALEVTKEPAEGRVIEIPSVPSELVRVEKGILPVLSEKGFSERSLFAVKLALEEALINAMKHGNKMDPTKKVTVSFALEDNEARITIKDEGPGFNPESIADPTLPENVEKETGRGIMLMRAYLDEVHYNDQGNEVTLVKYAPWAES